MTDVVLALDLFVALTTVSNKQRFEEIEARADAVVERRFPLMQNVVLLRLCPQRTFTSPGPWPLYL